MKLYLSPDTERKLREAISRDNVDAFSEFASTLKWGKPSWSASQLLLHVLAEDETRMWHWATTLVGHDDPHIRRYASQLFLHLWEENEPRAKQWLEKLADDEHWLVREDAHNAWGQVAWQAFQEDQAYSPRLDGKPLSEPEKMRGNCGAKSGKPEKRRIG